MQYFGHVEPFLRKNKHLAPSCHRHLLELFDDPVSAHYITSQLLMARLAEPQGLGFINRNSVLNSAQRYVHSEQADCAAQ